MFNKLVEFFKRIFRNKDIKLLEAGRKTKDNNNIEHFRKEIKFDDGQEGKELIKEILNEKNNNSKTQEEIHQIQEKLVEYIDVLIKKIDRCQNDIAVKQAELRKINN